MGEEVREEEKGEVRSELVTREGKKLVLIRWNTGKTSAGRLFGRYGPGGRPEFFKLLFGAVAGSLREQFGPDGENIFTRIRDSDKFRETSRDLFDGLKKWFFEEAVPKYKLERGDIFMISTELLLDPETGELTWNKEKTELVYWIRSDRCGQAAAPDYESIKRERDELAKEVERLKAENERLRRELEDVKEKLRQITSALK
ncbi:MAG: transcription factor [Thermoproteus sp.]